MKKCFFIIFTLFLNVSIRGNSQNSSHPLVFSLSSWSATLHPQGLKLYGCQFPSGENFLLGRAVKGQFLNPQIIEKSAQSATFFYPSQNLKIKVIAIKNRLHFNFKSSIEQKLVWPILGEDQNTKAIMYPEGEGLYIPLKDKFWHKNLNALSFTTQGVGLSAPFWGYDLGKVTLSLITHDDLLNELHFVVKDGKLTNTFSHDFRMLDNLTAFEISFALTEADPLAPAKHYKSYLIETGRYKTLQEKIKENPQIEKLIGAIHAYVWGDGRTVAALDKLDSLGIKRLWLGYEDKPPRPLEGKWLKKQHYVDDMFIRKAKDMGYLIGPYDSFHTMQSLDHSDCANVVFDDLYPQGCIYSKGGKPDKGFGGRGCHASSEALILQHPENKTILRRIEGFVHTGINSYFLDCDATGELFDDYAKDHPMTQSKDRENRVKRMVYIAHTKNMVLGSESAAAWAIPLLAFSHGNFSVHNSMHWPFVKSKTYGGWYPPERPAIFFQPLLAPPEYCQARYDPRYRLPLLQAVFHESAIMTDRWEISHMKLKNLVKRRELLELLYGVPSIWALDLKDLEKHGSHLKKLATFFGRLHQAIALKPLTDFKWLTEDRLIQQTVFGDAVILTANFSLKPFKGIPPESIGVKWLKENSAETYSVNEAIGKIKATLAAKHASHQYAICP